MEKRVLYIGGFCMPDGNAAAQRVLGVGKLLRACKFEVRFCGLERNIKVSKEGSIEGFAYKNYPYPASVTKWLRYLVGYDYVTREIDSYCPDIVILYNHPSFAIEHIVKYCHDRNIKVVADITEWYEPQGNPIFKLIKGYDTTRRMTKSHKKLDGLICISNYLANYYSNTRIPILNLPPLVDVKQEKWNQMFEKKQDIAKLVYAGSPGSSKDRLDLIIQALDRIIPSLDKCVKFDIIGITSEQYRATWNDTKDYPFANFHGRLPHTAVVKNLLEADFQIFLRPDTLPNRAGFPTKFVETISSKTIPITNLSSNLSDYLQDGVNGFVIGSLESNSIEQTLRNALSLTPDELENKQRALYSECFDFHNFINDCKSFISSL